jgi:hypothetical protein
LLVFTSLGARFFQELFGGREVCSTQGALQMVIDGLAFALVPLLELGNRAPDRGVERIAYQPAQC